MKKLFDSAAFFILLLFMVGCTPTYYKAADFRKIKKMDAHIHYLTADTAFNEQARKDNFRLIDINYDDEAYMSLDSMEALSLLQKQLYPKQFEYIASFTLRNWNSPLWVKETIQHLSSSFRNGAIAVKVWKNIGMYYKGADSNFIMIDNLRIDSVLQFIQSSNKALIAHMAEPKNCWLPLNEMTTNDDREYFGGTLQYYMYLHPDYPSYEELIKRRDTIVGRHPNLNIIGAHAGSLEWSVDELADRLDRYPNFCIDIAARLAHFQFQSQQHYKKVRDFMIKYQDRILYGSDEFMERVTERSGFMEKIDSIWKSQWLYLVSGKTMTSAHLNGSFKGLQLPKTVIDKIYRLNAIKWYKLKID
jgi:hypothetical protein